MPMSATQLSVVGSVFVLELELEFEFSANMTKSLFLSWICAILLSPSGVIVARRQPVLRVGGSAAPMPAVGLRLPHSSREELIVCVSTTGTRRLSAPIGSACVRSSAKVPFTRAVLRILLCNAGIARTIRHHAILPSRSSVSRPPRLSRN